MPSEMPLEPSVPDCHLVRRLPSLFVGVDGRAVGEDDAVGGIEGFQAHMTHTKGDDMIGKKLSTGGIYPYSSNKNGNE